MPQENEGLPVEEKKKEAPRLLKQEVSDVSVDSSGFPTCLATPVKEEKPGPLLKGEAEEKEKGDPLLKGEPEGKEKRDPLLKGGIEEKEKGDPLLGGGERGG